MRRDFRVRNRARQSLSQNASMYFAVYRRASGSVPSPRDDADRPRPRFITWVTLIAFEFQDNGASHQPRSPNESLPMRPENRTAGPQQHPTPPFPEPGEIPELTQRDVSRMRSIEVSLGKEAGR